MGSKKIVIVDYGMGNLGSIQNMLKYLGFDSRISDCPDEIENADKLILSGVGAFDAGIENLHARGLVKILHNKVIRHNTPVLGICLGMQLFTRRSEEGVSSGLGWLQADTIRFRFDPRMVHLKIPHMGWNTVQLKKSSRLFFNMEPDSRFYFVHSFHLRCDDQADVLAVSRHGYDFVSCVERDNIFGVQFHPEKSHKYGIRLLKNFSETI